MKRIASGITVLMLATGVWASEYWIQVLSIKADRVMGSDFLKRIEASGHAYETVVEEGLLKVRIGNLPSYEAAARLLPEVRRKVTADAFIVEAEVQDPAVETVPRELAIIPNGNHKPAGKPVAVAEKPKMPPVTENSAKAGEAVEAAAVTAPEAKSEAVQPPADTPCVCLYDKHALRKAEIAAALSYYKNSPYHRFGSMEQGWFSQSQ